MDVAIAGDVIARLAPDIAASDAKKVVNITGYYVTPGLIDIHAHVFVGNRPRAFAGGFSSVSPDDFSFRSGVTTVVDAGTSGWRNFPAFKEQVIDPSNTRVLAFLNIVGHGMWDDDHNNDLADMDARQTAFTMREYPDVIVGTKVGHFRGRVTDPFDRALEAADAADLPLLLECHLPEMPLEKLLGQMRPGDIFTHAFGAVNDRESVLDKEGKVRDYVLQARDRGILFDVGHGGGSFHFGQAVPALEQGLAPNTFGTDLHRGSMNAGMKDMLNIMSKYLNMGMELEDVLERATWNAAKALRRRDLGHLSEGAIADVAVLDVEQGAFGFIDSGGYKIKGDKKLEAELTIRAGRIVWDLNGLAAPNWSEE
jgi:dihydroorotase